MTEVNQREEQVRESKASNRKHDYYRNTRCTSTAQDEQIALPAGVFNVNEDSEDEAYCGEQKEVAREMQELRAAGHRVNQAGWDAVGEGLAYSRATGRDIYLRIDRDNVKDKLAKGSGADTDAGN